VNSINQCFLAALKRAHLAFWAAAILRLAAAEIMRFPPVAGALFTFAQRLLCASAIRLRASGEMVLGPELFTAPDPLVPPRTEIA
jgi:hypothetical protein